MKSPLIRAPLKSAQWSLSDHPVVTWVSLIVGFFIVLMPWKPWYGAPDILLLLIAFWALHGARGVGMVSAFLFGILVDVHDTVVLGQHALHYVICVYVILAFRTILREVSPIAQAVYLVPIFIGSAIPSVMLSSWLSGVWVGFGWFFSGITTAVLWVVLEWLMRFLLSNREDATL